jgi:hypothetical protein
LAQSSPGELRRKRREDLAEALAQVLRFADVDLGRREARVPGAPRPPAGSRGSSPRRSSRPRTRGVRRWRCPLPGPCSSRHRVRERALGRLPRRRVLPAGRWAGRPRDVPLRRALFEDRDVPRLGHVAQGGVRAPPRQARELLRRRDPDRREQQCPARAARPRGRPHGVRAPGGEGELSRKELSHAEAVFVRTSLYHSNVTRETNALRDCLYASALPRGHLSSRWFSRKNEARSTDRRR